MNLLSTLRLYYAAMVITYFPCHAFNLHLSGTNTLIVTVLGFSDSFWFSGSLAFKFCLICNIKAAIFLYVFYYILCLLCNI